MTPITIGILVFAATFGGALVGTWLSSALPSHHLDSASQSTVKLGIGLIATMTALVLGLVTASAKSSYDVLDSTVKHTAVDLLTLDRVLVRYGPEAASVRSALHATVASAIDKSWPKATSGESSLTTSGPPSMGEGLVQRIRALPVQGDEQGGLKTRALELGENLLEVRWVVISSFGTSVPVPFLVVLVFWLLVIFVSFGLSAPRNGTVISVLFVCAVSVASAIFLILEMDGPFSGLIQISPDPMLHALSQMTR